MMRSAFNDCRWASLRAVAATPLHDNVKYLDFFVLRTGLPAFHILRWLQVSECEFKPLSSLLFCVLLVLHFRNSSLIHVLRIISPWVTRK